MSRLTIALICLCSIATAQADLKFYGEARLGAGGVRHSDLDFYPTFGSFSAGVFIFENIGVEAFVDAPLAADTSGDFEVDIVEAAGAAIRFQSPPRNGVNAYMLLGFVNFELEQEEDGAGTLEEDFSGARVSIGLNQRLKRFPGVLFGAEYRNYFSDSGITVDGISLGLRFELQ